MDFALPDEVVRAVSEEREPALAVGRRAEAARLLKICCDPGNPEHATLLALRKAREAETVAAGVGHAVKAS